MIYNTGLTGSSSVHCQGKGCFNIERCHIYQQLTHLHYCWNEFPGRKQRLRVATWASSSAGACNWAPSTVPTTKEAQTPVQGLAKPELTHFVTHTKLAHTPASNTDPPTPLAAKVFQNRHMFLGKNNHKDDCLYLHASIGVKVITLWFLWAVCLLVWQHEEEEREQEIRKETG